VHFVLRFGSMISWPKALHTVCAQTWAVQSPKWRFSPPSSKYIRDRIALLVLSKGDWVEKLLRTVIFNLFAETKNDRSPFNPEHTNTARERIFIKKRL
jgi:hypothetical protein